MPAHIVPSPEAQALPWGCGGDAMAAIPWCAGFLNGHDAWTVGLLAVCFGVPIVIAACIWRTWRWDPRLWHCPECDALTTFRGPCGICGRETPGATGCLSGCFVVLATIVAVLVIGSFLFSLVGTRESDEEDPDAPQISTSTASSGKERETGRVPFGAP